MPGYLFWIPYHKYHVRQFKYAIHSLLFPSLSLQILMLIINELCLNYIGTLSIVTVQKVSCRLIQVYLFQMAEYRISVYGRKQSEWDQLASWFVNNAIYSDNAVWLIQVSCDVLFLSFLFLFLPFLC